jgi:hypothetical protein
VESDANGNVLTLGSFPNSADCLGQLLNDSTGSYFLSKLESAGNLIYAINFGNENSLSFGELEVNESGEIILVLNFKGPFRLHGFVLTSSVD